MDDERLRQLLTHQNSKNFRHTEIPGVSENGDVLPNLPVWLDDET